MIRSLLLALTTLTAYAGPGAAGPDEPRLLRFPAIHGDKIVFTYAGDLYTVQASGGIARRITSHPGFEMFHALGPDPATEIRDQLGRPLPISAGSPIEALFGG